MMTDLIPAIVGTVVMTAGIALIEIAVVARPVPGASFAIALGGFVAFALGGLLAPTSRSLDPSLPESWFAPSSASTRAAWWKSSD
jgi:hypothetical protein